MTTFEKIIATVLLLVALQCPVNAQQDPLFTQYFLNPLAANPAYAGTRDAMSINLLAREQWSGLKGSPSTQSLSIHAPMADSDLAWGLSVIADQHGPVKSTYLNIDMAYGFNVTEESKLSLGIRGGLHFYRANLSELEARNDISFQSDISSTAMPNFGFSAYWYSKTHFIGLSLPRLIENDFTETESMLITPKEKRHLFFTAGKVVTLSPVLKLKPTMLVKYISSAPVSVDVSVNLLIQERLWVGSFIRLKDAVGMTVSYQINNHVRIGYSYDKTVSELSGFNNGSHEILINYDLILGKDKVLSPKYF